MYKLYIAIGGGAYFCHRCGAKGSWYDFKSEIGGFGTDGTSVNGGGNGVSFLVACRPRNVVLVLLNSVENEPTSHSLKSLDLSHSLTDTE